MKAPEALLLPALSPDLSSSLGLSDRLLRRYHVPVVTAIAKRSQAYHSSWPEVEGQGWSPTFFCPGARSGLHCVPEALVLLEAIAAAAQPAASGSNAKCRVIGKAGGGALNYSSTELEYNCGGGK